MVPYPTRVPNLPCAQHPTSAACGVKHVVMIYNGELYGWGCNKSNQLGPSVFEKTETVVKLTGFHKICEATPVQVACGLKHTLVRCIDGSVWSAGDNTFKQLGHNPRNNQWGRVNFVDPIESVVCGHDTSYALSGGRLFSWGSVRHGSLGHGTTGEYERVVSGPPQYKDVEKPQLVKWFVGQRINVLEVSAGKDHMMARSDTEVYCVGQGGYGKLGQGNTEAHLLPRRVAFPERKYAEKLLSIAAGVDHSVVLKKSSEFGSVIYVWGRIDADNESNLQPRLITEAGPSVTKIIAAKCYTMAVSSDGTLHVWGKSTNCPTMGVADGVRKRWPVTVEALHGKHVVDALGSGGFMVAFTDDSKLAEGEPVDTVVPFEHRNPTYPYDVASLNFFQRVLGEAAGKTYFDNIPVPQKVEKGIKYTPSGAKSLHRGSRVRVWMTDVYALGTISRRDMDGFSKYHFEIDWAREDWDPETIELHSDDEGLDETNENRWQHLWFLELPDGCRNNAAERDAKNAANVDTSKAVLDEDE